MEFERAHLSCAERGSRLRGRQSCDIAFCVLFILIALLCIWKAPLEIQGYDESFYLTIPKRLLDGDALFVDEWHGSQFSALLLLPFIWLHDLLFGFSGILLHFRYLYVFFQAASSVVIYCRLRKYGTGALLASLFFFIFTPFDIMALSYNTMGLMLTTLSGVLLATPPHRKRDYVIAGLLFACAVLCCPLLPAAFILYSIAVLRRAAITRNRRCLQNWGLFLAGAACVAAVFFVFLFSRKGPSELLRSIPGLFSDPEHTSVLSLRKLLKYPLLLLSLTRHSFIYFALYAIAVLSALRDKRRCERAGIYVGISIAVALALLIEMTPRLITRNYNSIMCPLVTVGLMSYITSDRRDDQLFRFLFLGGFLYSLCLYLESNQKGYAISSALTMSSVASLVMLWDFWTQHRSTLEHRRLLRAALCLLLALQFCLMLCTKTLHKFWSDARNSELTQTIEAGPYRGIRVRPETEDAYMRQLATLEPMAQCKGSVLYATRDTAYYLMTPWLKIGAYSAWLSMSGQENHTTVDRLVLYYSANPKKVPDYIFIPDPNSWDMPYMKRQLLDPWGYEPLEYSGATVYRRPEARLPALP